MVTLTANDRGAYLGGLAPRGSVDGQAKSVGGGSDRLLGHRASRVAQLARTRAKKPTGGATW